ncbi:MAG: electron transfer flavoprotein subunit alpha/FixB family protein [Spirochaetes bacterium]|nr:MAG: electron transfer flavoprotein subunit alpha/FixB family protein [Spirochaetota bacterium]
MTRVLIVLAERAQGPAPFAMAGELAACARAFGGNDAEIALALLGGGTEEMTTELSRATGCPVYSFEYPHGAVYSCETCTTALAALARETGASVVLVPHTPRGYDFAPRLAARLGAACVTGVEGIERNGDTVRFSRSACFGKLRAAIARGEGLVVATVMPGSFGAPDNACAGSPEVYRRPAPGPWMWTHTVSERVTGSGSQDFSSAEVIVSAGKGMQKKENVELARELAKRFPRSAVGGSRIACDLGWLGYESQIGITGRSVAPRLYIACGISGAFQHVSAIRGSRYIAAINRDPWAAIFREADIGVVEDAVHFIPLLIAEIDRRKGTS